MKELESGKDKVRKLCEVLRKETLEPARAKADQIIYEAEQKAEQILIEARRRAEQLQQEAKQEIERQRQVFQSSLTQACKQALHVLKETVEEKLFQPALLSKVTAATSDPTALAGLITAVVHALEREGITSDISAYVPATVSREAVNSLLVQEVLARLREGSVQLGTFVGGAAVRLLDQKMTLDITAEALKDLVARYIGKGLREVLYREGV